MKFIVEEFTDTFQVGKLYNALIKLTPAQRIDVSPSLGKDWKPKPMVFPNFYLNSAEEIFNIPVRSDDVCVFAYPKSGITWSLEMIWLIMNNFDFDRAKKLELDQRYFYYEIEAVTGEFKDLQSCFVRNGENIKSPRLIKSHLSASFLPKDIWKKKPKMIYISRDIRDVIVSFYHYTKHFMGHTASIEEFCVEFMADKIMYTPYWAHILDFWKMRNDENVLFLTYEEMKKDLSVVIRKCCDFLNVMATEENISRLYEHLKFENMKDNPAVNNEKRLKLMGDIAGVKNDFKFMRKGKVSAYKEEIPEECVKKIEKWIQENLKDTDLDMYK